MSKTLPCANIFILITLLLPYSIFAQNIEVRNEAQNILKGATVTVQDFALHTFAITLTDLSSGGCRFSIDGKDYGWVDKGKQIKLHEDALLRVRDVYLGPYDSYCDVNFFIRKLANTNNLPTSNTCSQALNLCLSQNGNENNNACSVEYLKCISANILFVTDDEESAHESFILSNMIIFLAKEYFIYDESKFVEKVAHAKLSMASMLATNITKEILDAQTITTFVYDSQALLILGQNVQNDGQTAQHVFAQVISDYLQSQENIRVTIVSSEKISITDLKTLFTHKNPSAELLPAPDKKTTLSSEESVQQQELPSCEDGCYLNGEVSRCIPVGTRLRYQEVNSYCDFDGKIKAQKEDNLPASNNYECYSNSARYSICEPVAEQVGLLKKIFSWLTNIFE